MQIKILSTGELMRWKLNLNFNLMEHFDRIDGFNEPHINIDFNQLI